MLLAQPPVFMAVKTTLKVLEELLKAKITGSASRSQHPWLARAFPASCTSHPHPQMSNQDYVH